jgi:methylmalonyl-CoA/ethylmalonyl-CoA epimerase
MDKAPALTDLTEALGFEVLKIDHLGIAVRDLEAALAPYRLLGLEVHEFETVEDQGVRTAVLPLGESRLELLEPTRPDSPVARFLEKRGEGIHHVAIGVDDVRSALVHLESRGVELIDRTPRRGAGGAMIAFLHPRAMRGVLLELCQRGPHS